MLGIESELKRVYLNLKSKNLGWVSVRFIFTRFVLLARDNLDELGPRVGERQLCLSRGQLRFRRVDERQAAEWKTESFLSPNVETGKDFNQHIMPVVNCFCRLLLK